LDLDRVHVGLEHLLPETICCAETQERYVLAVPRRFTPEVLRIYNEDWDLPNVYEGACAAVVGTFNDTGRYVLKHQGKIVCNAPVDVVTSGISYDREQAPREHTEPEPDFEQPADLGRALLTVLGHENVCSREYVYRAYDTEVQGNAVIRPGEADAAVCAPLEGCPAGVALAMDGNPAYGAISPYWGGANAVAEACRNVAAVGAVPSGVTDCLNYGNPEKPTAFWQFVEGVRGIADAARKIGLKGYPGQPVPVISGNVSFYNESASGSAVEPSGIIACIGVLADYSKAVTMQLKRAGDSLYLVGSRYDECGGSAYYQALGLGLGRNVPEVRWEEQQAAIYGMIDAIDAGLVAACHDISDGGLGIALAEMVLGGYARGRLGARVNLAVLDSDLRLDKQLFSESAGFVAEVRVGANEEFETLFADSPVSAWRIGEVVADPVLEVNGALSLGMAEMAEAWTGGLPSRLR
jgi:phosphoribosylformylglycinamidine (FGAM) synthase-like enzyme